MVKKIAFLLILSFLVASNILGTTGFAASKTDWKGKPITKKVGSETYALGTLKNNKGVVKKTLKNKKTYILSTSKETNTYISDIAIFKAFEKFPANKKTAAKVEMGIGFGLIGKKGNQYPIALPILDTSPSNARDSYSVNVKGVSNTANSRLTYVNELGSIQNYEIENKSKSRKSAQILLNKKVIGSLSTKDSSHLVSIFMVQTGVGDSKYLKLINEKKPYISHERPYILGYTTKKEKGKVIRKWSVYTPEYNGVQGSKETKTLKRIYDFKSGSTLVNNLEKIYPAHKTSVPTVKGSWVYDKKLKKPVWKLNWSSKKDVIGYKIYKSKDGNSSFRLMKIQNGIKNTSYLDTKLKDQNSEVPTYAVSFIFKKTEGTKSAVNIPNYTIDWDKDGLTDYTEQFIQTNAKKKDTDGDKLPDGYEVNILKTSPLLKDTNKNKVSDAQEDSDHDGLTNYKEFILTTNPLEKDTDGDNITDGVEVKTDKTNPLLKDTDNDGLDDDSEKKFKTNPLKKDSNGNGIIDGNEPREQQVVSKETNVMVDFKATGDAVKETTISPNTDVSKVVGKQGIVGTPIHVETSSDFKQADLKFTYNSNDLKNIKPEDLRVFYFNPKTRVLELVEKQSIDKNTNTVTAEVKHFSTYLLADLSLWSKTWSETAEKGTVSNNDLKKKKEIAFVIDSSGSMGPGPNDDYNNDLENNRIKGTQQLIDSITDKDKIALIDFDYYGNVLSDFVFGTKENKDMLKQKANQIDAYGGTAIYSGLKRALDLFEKQNTTIETTSKQIILLTDGIDNYSYNYSQLIEQAKNLKIKITTIGLGNKTDTVLLKRLADETGGDYFVSLTSDNLVEIFKYTGNTAGVMEDKDKDSIPDWVELKGVYVKGTLGEQYAKLDPTKPDTDGDGINDSAELGDWYYDPATGKVFVSRESLINGVKNRPTTSNPTTDDTDEDGDKDNIDDKPDIPFKSPIVLLHGILSNTEKGWGASLHEFDSHQDAGSITVTPNNTATLLSNIPASQTYTGSNYHKGDEVEYGNIDLHYILKAKNGELSGYLEDKGYEINKNLYAFNWEANGHIINAANNLNNYLINLTNFLKSTNEVDITTNGRASITLIGHSAGGLVSRYYIENMMDKSKPQIQKLITVATPHWGSNQSEVYKNITLNNGGLCNRVFEDLDRDDSYLFYENIPKFTMCSRDGNPLSLNTSGAKYYALSGIVTEKIYNKRTEDIEIPSSQSSSSSKIFAYFQKEFKKLTGEKFPDLVNGENGIEDSAGSWIDTKLFFGDQSVAGGSALGVPSDKQKGNENRIENIPMERRTIFFGPKAGVSHTTINHNEKTYSWIYENIKD